MNARAEWIGRKFAIRTVAAALALGAWGCIDDFDTINDGQFGSGPSCESLCERFNECIDEPSTNCRENCREVEDIADRAGCEDEFADYLNCVDDVPDLCEDTSDVCPSELEDFSDCIAPYCNDSGNCL